MTLFLAFAGCAQPLHLQYDHARAYRDSLDLQAQIDRPGAVASQYMLQGEEALALRKNVRDITTGTTKKDSINASVLK